MQDNWDYEMNGRKNSIAGIIFLSIVFIGGLVLTLDQIIPDKNKSVIIAFFFGAFTLSTFYFLAKLLNRFFFFKVKIGRNGLFLQTNPFNGKYYEYCDISSCRIEERTNSGAGASKRIYVNYFIFVYKGKAVEFIVEPVNCEEELDALKSRINKEIQ